MKGQMKFNILLGTVNYVNAIPSAVVTNNTNLTKEQDELLKVLSNFSDEEKQNLFGDIVDNVMDYKKSTKKAMNEITEQKTNDIFNSMLKKIENSNIENKYELLEKLKQKKNEFRNELIKNLKKETLNFKTNEKNNKKTINTIIKRVNSSLNNQEWKINDDGTISSKFLLKEYEELNKNIEFFKTTATKTMEEITYLQKWKIGCVSMVAISATTAAGLWIASLFCPACSIAAVAASAAANVFLIAASTLSNKIRSLEKILKESNSILNSIYSKNYNLPIWSMASDVPVVLGKIAKIFELVKNYKDLCPLTSIGQSALSIVQASFKFYDVYKSSKELDYFSDLTISINDQIKKFIDKAKNLKKIGWVVVHETTQTGPYDQGGTGGKNLIFKNLETSEVKTLDEMLQYTDFELSMWNLQRVQDSKKGTYLRRYKNDILEDNLG